MRGCARGRPPRASVPTAPRSPRSVSIGACLRVLGVSVGVSWHALWLCPLSPPRRRGPCRRRAAHRDVSVCVCVRVPAALRLSVRLSVYHRVSAQAGAAVGGSVGRSVGCLSVCASPPSWVCLHRRSHPGLPHPCRHVPVSPLVPVHRGSAASVCARPPPSLRCLCARRSSRLPTLSPGLSLPGTMPTGSRRHGPSRPSFSSQGVRGQPEQQFWLRGTGSGGGSRWQKERVAVSTGHRARAAARSAHGSAKHPAPCRGGKGLRVGEAQPKP